MNNVVAVRKCRDYEINEVYKCISEIYKKCGGDDLKDRRVLIKPNILSDDIPEKCISTHPVVIEAMIMFLRDNGAEVVLGDSPAAHMGRFRPEKSGIWAVCEKTGTPWIDFTEDPLNLRFKGGRIRIASVVKEVDLIISLPKLKNHELVYFTGAIKNTLGLVPGFSKAKQHALHHDRESFSSFLVNLNEAIMPHFFLMDGIKGMDGRGPGQGNPVNTCVLIGSSNPLALDIIASTIAGYDPEEIPVNRIALSRGKWLNSPAEINYDGPELKSVIKRDFKRIPISSNAGISLKFLKNRVKAMKSFEKRPVFNPVKCTGCLECISICPQKAITMHPVKNNNVVLKNELCIKCYCCSEVCRYGAVTFKRKLFFLK